MRFFEVQWSVGVRESSPLGGAPEGPSEGLSITVTVEMGDGATKADAVARLREQLEKMCNDAPPYDGD